MNRHNVIIKRAVERRVYKFSETYWGWSVTRDQEFIENEFLWTGELDSPILQAGEKLYINEIEELVAIKEVIRTTTGDYLYVCPERVIEDEKTESTFKQAKEEEETYKSEQEELEMWTGLEMGKSDEKKKKSWHSHLRSKFKPS